MERLLVTNEIEELLMLRRGCATRMAKAGLIPHVILPDGSIRFDPSAIQRWLAERSVPEFAAAGDGVKN